MKKDVGFIWSLWHKTFVVNEWKAKANPRIEVRCLLCDQNTIETILHKF